MDDRDRGRKLRTELSDLSGVELDSGNGAGEAGERASDRPVPSAELEHGVGRRVTQDLGHCSREPAVDQQVLAKLMRTAIGDRMSTGWLLGTS
jgi:hypothetical protein